MLVTGKGKAKSTQELISASIEALIGALESGHAVSLLLLRQYSLDWHAEARCSHVAGMYAWKTS